MFSDTSLKWTPRELNNSRFCVLSDWTATRDNFKWHQIQEKYNIPVDLIFSDEDVVPVYKS